MIQIKLKPTQLVSGIRFLLNTDKGCVVNGLNYEVNRKTELDICAKTIRLYMIVVLIVHHLEIGQWWFEGESALTRLTVFLLFIINILDMAGSLVERTTFERQRMNMKSAGRWRQMAKKHFAADNLKEKYLYVWWPEFFKPFRSKMKWKE